jgi:hypothetical protein
MSKTGDKPETSAEKSARQGAGWGGKAAIAGAAIGSAALMAALLYSTRRKDKAEVPTAPPAHPEDAPETD